MIYKKIDSPVGIWFCSANQIIVPKTGSFAHLFVQRSVLVSLNRTAGINGPFYNAVSQPRRGYRCPAGAREIDAPAGVKPAMWRVMEKPAGVVSVPNHGVPNQIDGADSSP